MKLHKKYPVLGSSANPEQLSLTVKSIGIWLVPMIIGIAKISGLDIQENDLMIFVDNASIVIASVITMYGVGRKIYYQVKNLFIK